MLGAHLLLELTRNQLPVRAIRRPASDLTTVRKIFAWYSEDPEKWLSRIEWVEGDLTDPESLFRLMKGADAVIHAAARVSFDPREKEEMIAGNVQTTALLTEVALELGITRFCHVSSIAALGEGEDEIPVTEELTWKNDRRRSAYSESKFQSEMEVWRAVEEGLPAVIVNPSVILGAGNWDKGSPALFKIAHDGMKFYTPGQTGFVSAQDVAAAIVLLIRSDRWDELKGRRYLLSAENLSYRSLFDQMARSVNRPSARFKASRWMVALAWRSSGLLAKFTGHAPALTRDTARSSFRKTLYDGSAITRAIHFQYTPIDETISALGKLYLADLTKTPQEK